MMLVGDVGGDGGDGGDGGGGGGGGSAACGGTVLHSKVMLELCCM